MDAVLCALSWEGEVDPKSLHIGHLWRRGRVLLFDWLYESKVSGQGRGELPGAGPESAASARGWHRRGGELEKGVG